MSWEDDQQSKPWNAAFTKRQVLAWTLTDENSQELITAALLRGHLRLTGWRFSFKDAFGLFGEGRQDSIKMLELFH
jgi:hypothetical protein